MRAAFWGLWPVQANEILKEELDPMVEIIRIREPELYSDYHIARLIKDIGVRHKKGQKAIAGSHLL
jgi:hypothetical protein